MGQVRVSVADRLDALRTLLRRGVTTFDEAVKDADRVTVCITLFALLEMYKQGEATWDQPEPFGQITIAPGEGRPVAEAATA
jgi:segregation and condensation protein A